jgi:hypothetical protein
MSCELDPPELEFKQPAMNVSGIALAAASQIAHAAPRELARAAPKPDAKTRPLRAGAGWKQFPPLM